MRGVNVKKFARSSIQQLIDIKLFCISYLQNGSVSGTTFVAGSSVPRRFVVHVRRVTVMTEPQ